MSSEVPAKVKLANEKKCRSALSGTCRACQSTFRRTGPDVADVFHRGPIDAVQKALKMGRGLAGAYRAAAASSAREGQGRAIRSIHVDGAPTAASQVDHTTSQLPCAPKDASSSDIALAVGVLL